MTTEHVWFEVRIETMSTSHATLEEAKAKLLDMKKGHPENERMTDENRAYWKRVSKKAVINKVVQTTEKVI